jgi:hypothetical protein
MFDKITRYAERVATSASLSRRGFLGRLGETALGVAGLVGALLVLSNRAEADHDLFPFCGFLCPDGSHVFTFRCPCPLNVTTKDRMRCIRDVNKCSS